MRKRMIEVTRSGWINLDDVIVVNNLKMDERLFRVKVYCLSSLTYYVFKPQIKFDASTMNKLKVLKADL